MVGDKLINPIVGVYIPIITSPIKGEMTIPNTGSLDPGTLGFFKVSTNPNRSRFMSLVCQTFDGATRLWRDINTVHGLGESTGFLFAQNSQN